MEGGRITLDSNSVSSIVKEKLQSIQVIPKQAAVSPIFQTMIRFWRGTDGNVDIR